MPAKLAVVNEKLLRERLNGEKNLQATKLILNGEPYSVIGVVTESFKQPFDPDVEVWMPVGNFPGNQGQREARFLFGMGHLKPGVSRTERRRKRTRLPASWRSSIPRRTEDVAPESSHYVN